MVNQIIWTLLVGLIGGLVAKKLKVPAAFMIGSMVAVGLISVLTGAMYAPSELKLFAQIVSGAFIGQQVTKQDLINLPKLWQPMLLLLGFFTLNMIVLGFVFVALFEMDLVTALLSCLPGGIMDVSLMSIDMGAQADVVASLQTIRLVGMLMILPAWVNFIMRKLAARKMVTVEEEELVHLPSLTGLDFLQQTKNDGLILLVAALGGGLGYLTGLPVGTLIFALLVSIWLKLSKETQKLRPIIRYIAQVCAGSIIGTSFTQASLLRIKQLIVPAILLLGAYLVINAIFSAIIYRKGIMDLQSALFASSPAGATDISLIAGELGGDMAKIASIQVSRMLYTVIIMPNIVKAILWISYIR